MVKVTENPSDLLDWLSQNRDSHIIKNVIINHLNDENIKEECMETIFKRLFELPSGTKFTLLLFILFSVAFCVPSPVYADGLVVCGLETAILVGAGLSAAAGVGSSLLNAGAQRSANAANKKMTEDTNATNLQIQRETNEQNYKIWQEQLGQRNQEIAYNSPVESRARSEAAGYNPYFADVPTGNVESVMSPTAPTMQAASMQAPHVEPVKQDFSSLGDSVNSFFQNQYVQSQTENQKIKNIFEADNQIADLNKKIADKNTSQALRDVYKAQKDALLAKYPEEVNQMRANIRLANQEIAYKEAQTQFVHAQTDYQNLLCEYYPQITDAQLKQVSANTEQAYASAFAAREQGLLSRQEAKQSVEEAAAAAMQAMVSSLEGVGISLDNEQKDKLNKVILENAKKTGKEIESRTAKNWADIEDTYLGPGGRWRPGRMVPKFGFPDGVKGHDRKKPVSKNRTTRW